MEPSPDQPASPLPATPPPGATPPPAAPPSVAPLSAPPRHDQPPLDAHAIAAASRDVVRRALQEDLGNHGDVTSIATIAADATGAAYLVARADGVIAGTALVGQVFEQLDPRVEVGWQVREGDVVSAGQHLGRVSGPMRSVLTGERTALNFLTHLSGVATRTYAYAQAIAGTDCVVRDTRKTTPGLRLLEKAAVRAGGGVSHRIGLFDALLVKDNHVAAAGSVANATRRAIARSGSRPVQVEVDSLAQLDEAVEAGARDVLLDNFDVETTRAAVQRVRDLEARHGRILLESSGGITLDNVADYARTGVDRIAVGALTHSAPQLDIGLDFHLDGGN
ncbi:MAG TPA: carboxylating nicotinate-nucleotide diphosphorylase [Egicoccus sp.]|nr:carboxylating nicotinate-nucleotide diphosphorylase [Egicoccus sp.]HSK24745.1 carboxylating nicotinate-nucleotide diphosphorylase [Egicoccus sp.]